jgi:muramoyltetrapeptide carboxypeptidase
MLPGQAEGKLYGGCLSMLVASLGTPYEIRTEDAILFVEDVASKPYQIDRMLMQLKLAGKLAAVRGIVFGVMRDCAAPAGAGYDLCQVLHSVVADLGIPVAFGLNSGHVDSNNLTLPLGIRATLSVKEEAAILQLMEPAVSLD